MNKTRQPVVLDLPPTTTHPGRFLVWVRYTEPGYPVWGVLTVAESMGRRQVVRRYVVGEYRPRTTPGRGFAFWKPPGLLEDKHHTVVDRTARCRCEGFARRGDCVHVQCLAALAGHLSRGEPCDLKKPRPAGVSGGRTSGRRCGRPSGRS